ncbi:hypothetical protein ACQ4PT_032485 [Festuca glaucescens]
MASLLLALLLLSTAPAATATAVGQQQCEPNVLAKHVSAVCAPGKPTTRCCDEVIAVVDLPCLCRVAARRPRGTQYLVYAAVVHLLRRQGFCCYGGLRHGLRRGTCAGEEVRPGHGHYSRW